MAAEELDGVDEARVERGRPAHARSPRGALGRREAGDARAAVLLPPLRPATLTPSLFAYLSETEGEPSA